MQIVRLHIPVCLECCSNISSNAEWQACIEEIASIQHSMRENQRKTHFHLTHTYTNMKLSEAVKLLIYIWEVPGSNLSRFTSLRHIISDKPISHPQSLI
jgi:hypothetical protein